MNAIIRPQKLENLEFAVLMAAVFFAPYNSFRHPAIFFTISDFFFVCAFFLRATRGLPVSPFGAATLVWLAGFIMLEGGLLVSSVVNGDASRGLIVFVQYFFAYICLPLVILWRSYEQSIQLLKCFIWAMFIMCVFGTAVYLTGYKSVSSNHFAVVTGSGRLSALVDNPNRLASLIDFTLPLLWFLTLVRAISVTQTVVFSCIFFIALILTSSNSGLASALVVMIIFILGKGSLRIIVFGAVASCAVGAAILLWGEHFLPATFQTRVMGAISSGDVSDAGTFNDRYELMVEAWQLSESYLFLGMGSDQYREISVHSVPVHNTYLLLLTEGGLIALTGLLVVMCSALIIPFVVRNKPTGYPILLSTVALVITMSAIYMNFAHVYARYLLLPLLLIIGPAIALYRNRD